MLKNTPGQTLRVMAVAKRAITVSGTAYQTGDPIPGIENTITCKWAIDGGSPQPLADVNPLEQEDGSYLFSILQAETNGDTLDPYPESSIAGVAVLPMGHDRQTIRPTGVASQTVTPVDAINQAMAEAVEAQEAGDYAAALRKTEAAWMRLCALPDSEFENERLEWSRDGLGSLLEWLKKRVNETAVDPATGGRGSIIRPAAIVYQRG